MPERPPLTFAKMAEARAKHPIGFWNGSRDRYAQSLLERVLPSETQRHFDRFPVEKSAMSEPDDPYQAAREAREFALAEVPRPRQLFEPRFDSARPVAAFLSEAGK